MINKSFFDELSEQIARILPAANAMGEDVKNGVNSALHSGFQKLDLVTREEFEVQKQALQRAQEKLTLLEEQLARLEQERNNPTQAA